MQNKALKELRNPLFSPDGSENPFFAKNFRCLENFQKKDCSGQPGRGL